MKVHHLNCGGVRPTVVRLIDGVRYRFRMADMVTHCLLVETGQGLALVDTGFGVGCVERPAAMLGRAFLFNFRPTLDLARTAVRQVEALGHSPGDVRHIILTHMDPDHVGGLPDFPRAKVHVHAPEYEAAMTPRSANEKQRYRASLWAHGPYWQAYGVTGGERWYGFDAVRQLRGLPDDILLIPLAGHTHGHTGVAVRAGDRWLLHAGDAFFHHGEVDPVRPHCTPGLRLAQSLFQQDRTARHRNQARLVELARDHGDEIDIFCAHDPAMLPGPP